MIHCPACGEANPDSAKFCNGCRTRLEGAMRLDLGEGGKPAKEPPFPRPNGRLEGPGMSTASLVMGIVGLGIPAIVTGVIALKKHKSGRGKALAGIVFGCIGTVVLAAVLAASLSRKDPLRLPLTAETTPAFVEAASARVDRLDERVAESVSKLGPGGGQEMAPVYAILGAIRQDLAEMDSLSALDSLEDETLLDTLRGDVLDRLGQARDLLGER
jgi:hypothetical protein